MESIFGPTLVGKKGQIQTRTLNNLDIVMLFASASWCPPCRQFFPTLLEFYNTVNHNQKRLEIVWLSRDRSLEDFDSIRKQIPWVAVPYDPDKIGAILERYDIDVIPKLYLLNRDGSIAHTECRQDIVSKGPVTVNDWVNMRT